VVFKVGVITDHGRPPQPFGQLPNKLRSGGGKTLQNFIAFVLPQLVGEVPEGRWGPHFNAIVDTLSDRIGIKLYHH
jgi:hypothetical protein